MPKKSIVFILLWLSAAVFYLSGCQNSNTAPAKFGFKDERSMSEALRGTWILQEYMDSIDAGLTPKLLEFMLENIYSIKYTSDTDCLFVLGMGGARITADYDKAWREQRYSVDFLTSSGLMIFTNRDTKKIDTAQFVIDGSDTILKIRDTSAIYFVKYDASRCQNIDEYNHLINSKFIAGKYYLANDTGRTHHIIFTKCGKVEGVEYISSELKDHSDYDVQFTHFSTYPDAITFNNPKFKIGRQYYWEVIKDTLRLYSQYQDGHETNIFLVK